MLPRPEDWLVLGECVRDLVVTVDSVFRAGSVKAARAKWGDPFGVTAAEPNRDCPRFPDFSGEVVLPHEQVQVVAAASAGGLCRCPDVDQRRLVLPSSLDSVPLQPLA